MRSPTFLGQDPGPVRHRWLVTHVLTVAAVEIGHPIAILVNMISHDGLMHAQHSLVPSSSTFKRYATLARMLTRTEAHA
jgi:hypothetical protein